MFYLVLTLRLGSYVFFNRFFYCTRYVLFIRGTGVRIFVSCVCFRQPPLRLPSLMFLSFLLDPRSRFYVVLLVFSSVGGTIGSSFTPTNACLLPNFLSCFWVYHQLVFVMLMSPYSFLVPAAS